jgi:hypothetical protein
MSQFIPLGIFVLLGVLFYILGAPTRRNEVDVPLGEPIPTPAVVD